MTAATPPDAEAESGASSLLRTLLLCDLVDSTGMVERLGDLTAAELIRKHDRLARTVADRHGGREIDKTDGFMMMFERPVQAVAFALDYQRGLKQLNAAENASLSARVGIHVGDVVVWDNSSEDIAKGAKPVEVEGLVKPVTSRLMSLALPGQILLSNIAYDLAHRAQGELGEQLADIRWRTHGRYRFRGVPDPVAVFEVGEEGLAPLKAPSWSSKAHREVPFWRRPSSVVIEALVVAALIVVPLVMFLRPDPAIAFAKRDWVVVGSLHNLTGESIFDDALESALRIGLEQSRYVNVLPDLKVRDTITRMQRDPDMTEVDRAIGSEVAIRDGARALILPTIAEIGGRVRITAEVIDPQTQTTVYSETADGIGKESILPSLDTINERLRVRLGEALATVSNESKPLEKVATKNLDALKAYSLGSAKGSRGLFPEALALFNQALTIDPDFASAHLRIAIIHVSMGKSDKALEDFKIALSQRGRLTIRDALYAESFIATLEQSADWFGKWQVLVDTYPDFFTATGGFAYMAWRDANRIDEKNIALALSSGSEKNPNPLPSRHLLGTLYLANERYAEANKVFSAAESDGLTYKYYHAASEAAQRNFQKSMALLDSMPKRSAVGDSSLERSVFDLALLLDQGRFPRAKDGFQQSAAALPANSLLSAQLETIELTVRPLTQAIDREKYKSALISAIDQVKHDRTGAEITELSLLLARQSMLAYLAAAQGDLDLARSALPPNSELPASDRSAVKDLWLIADAEITRLGGERELAISKLKSLIDGNELFITHVALLDAYTAAEGDESKAIQEANWLISHRGRAYTEAVAEYLLVAFNVMQSNVALLRAAELALEQGDKTQAESKLARFRKQWPEASRASPYSARADAVEANLGVAPSR